MAAFKIKTSDVFRIEPTVPGVGKLPRMSAGTRDLKIARQMEDALVTIATRDQMPDLIEQLRSGTVKLKEVWSAHLKPKKERLEALESLRTRQHDTLLSEVVPQRKTRTKDERVKSGYDQLLELAPKDARVSWLTVSTNLNDIYERAMEERAANSVRRSLHRAVCDLLTNKYGRGKMLAVIADAEVPGEQDERAIEVSREKIKELADAANSDPVFVNAVGFAITTGIDRAPMLKLTPTSVDEDGIVTVDDTKNPGRFRRFKLDTEALRYFRLACAGKKNDQAVFNYSNSQLRDRWEALREKVGRKDLRWKDLRAVYATYALEAGMSPRELQHRLGHSTMSMTLRYVKRIAATGETEVGKAMGMGRSHLKVEKKA